MAMLKVQIKSMQLGSFQLKNIGFSIRRGETYALIGMNGSGKTTLLKTIAGIYSDYKGEILFKEKSLNSKFVEYIPPLIQPQLSIKTKYFLEISTNKLKLSLEDREKIEKVTQLLKIQDLIEKDIRVLSSGETVKILLARALIRNKPIILWDEPTSFLDIRYKFYIKKLINRLKKKRIFIISSHDLKWLNKITDSYIGLKDGLENFQHDNLSTQDIKKLLC